MLETDNYNLPLYEANDAPNLLDGYNNAMQTLDVQVKNISTSADNATQAAANAAPINHAATSGIYGIGTASNFGHVQLSDSTDSQSQASAGIAATPYAVRATYQAAQAKAPINHASTGTQYGQATSKNYGHVLLTNAIINSGPDNGLAVSPDVIYGMFTFEELTPVPAGQAVACPHGWMSGRRSFDDNTTFFKAYGNPTFITASEITAFKNACVTIPGLSATGVAIFSGLSAPSTPYEVGTGGLIATGTSSTEFNWYSLGQTVLAVGSDGRIYLEWNSQMEGKSFAVMQMPASLYVNVNFDDASQKG